MFAAKKWLFCRLVGTAKIPAKARERKGERVREKGRESERVRKGEKEKGTK